MLERVGLKNNAILVIGAGIAGIQTSIDLANLGFQVHLVENMPSIGGRMAQLDKTFPTNDCSMCILAPKMVECASHERINLLTYSEVIEVEGQVGDFRTKVLKKPRFVDLSKCTACGECVEACPRRVPNEFNLFLDNRKAIYLSFPQAVPRRMTIDSKNCLRLLKAKCSLCKDTCQAGAIDFEQEEEIVKLAMGAIVLAVGFDPYDVSTLKEYGYGEIENVITGLEFERLISTSGPTSGRMERLSDRKAPQTIAFIQCVGSRDVNHNPYCSTVCCMHATKEAVLAREQHPDLQSFVFYTDLRAPGKTFQEYVAMAKEQYGVAYIRARPGKVVEENGRPVIWYEETVFKEKEEPKVRKVEVDLVVLCQALGAHRSLHEVARKLGVELDKDGFIQIPDRVCRPVDTSVEGVFACGFCQSPQDIPDSVIQASGAAARAAEVLSEPRAGE